MRWHTPASWFKPGHMFALGGRLFLLSVFQDFLDKRELQRGYDDAALQRSATDEVVVDYVADTGDGFTATYSVFRQFNPDAMGHPDVLVLGGDQVYPTATSAAYAERFAGPLASAVPTAYLDHVCDLINRGELDEARAALQPIGDPEWHRHQLALLRSALRASGRTNLLVELFAPAASSDDAPLEAEPPDEAPPVETEPPLMVAIPGNHDWYDGLTAFGRQFMEPGTNVGAFETGQHRSYWALDVMVDGRRWWLWGVDMALDADVDRAQLDYFAECGAVAGEPVVLFVAAPLWTYAEHRSEQLYQFEQRAIFDRGLQLVLVLSGDRHYYMRRESGVPAEDGGRRPDAPPRITAGLGGAFKHPPHLEKAVPMLWESGSDRQGRSRRTLPYIAAQLPGGVPWRRDGAADEVEGSPSPPVEVSFPGEQGSRRMVGIRRSLSAWWRWNRSFTLIPLVISLITAVTTLQTSEFWRQDADFSETSFWQLGTYMVISFNALVLLLILGLAFFLAAPDPAAHLQRAQRLWWTVVHALAHVIALWLSMWAAQRIAARWLDQIGTDATSDRVWEGVAFLTISSVLGALAFTAVLLLYFWVTNRVQMSVNALASWNMEQNYVGFVRLRFTKDSIIGEVHGVTDVKVEDPEKIWSVVADPRGTEATVEPRWERAPLVLVDHFDIRRPAGEPLLPDR